MIIDKVDIHIAFDLSKELQSIAEIVNT